MSNIKEECGVFAIWDGSESVNKTYLGIFSLQHRGQESAGIASTTGEEINGFTGRGTVGRVFRRTRNVLPRLTENCRGAIGHVRYSTSAAVGIQNGQPLVAEYSQGPIAIAHNGSLTNGALLRDEYEAYGSIFKSASDAETIVHMLAKPTHITKPDPVAHVLGHLRGAFSLVMMFADRIEAARDSYGIRPLSIGKTKSGAYCVASESCAFDAIDAKFIRDVEPGEIVTIDDTGISYRRFAQKRSELAQCIFENIYFSKQNSTIFGENVYLARKKMGRQLAKEHPIDADVVIPIPDSGTASAIGFSHESGIPFEMGFVRSHYVGRSFIAPSDELRQQMIKLKLAIVKEVVAGKRVVIVDDSIVRGNTTKSKVRSLRESGAKEVHIRICCPPIKFPCFYGVDFPTKEELVANRMNIDELRDFLNADSLGYISLEGMVGCMNQPSNAFCTACWSGNYKVPTYSQGEVYTPERYQRNLFEDLEIENA